MMELTAITCVSLVVLTTLSLLWAIGMTVKQAIVKRISS